MKIPFDGENNLNALKPWNLINEFYFFSLSCLIIFHPTFFMIFLFFSNFSFLFFPYIHPFFSSSFFCIFLLFQNFWLFNFQFSFLDLFHMQMHFIVGGGQWGVYIPQSVSDKVKKRSLIFYTLFFKNLKNMPSKTLKTENENKKLRIKTTNEN